MSNFAKKFIENSPFKNNNSSTGKKPKKKYGGLKRLWKEIKATAGIYDQQNKENPYTN